LVPARIVTCSLDLNARVMRSNLKVKTAQSQPTKCYCVLTVDVVRHTASLSPWTTQKQLPVMMVQSVVMKGEDRHRVWLSTPILVNRCVVS
jgi:hypothetical protein